MMISYRSHPIIGLINGNSHFVQLNSGIGDKHKTIIMHGLNYIFNNLKDKLNQNTLIVTKPFLDASLLCNDKMIKSELYKEIGDDLSGVLIFGKSSIIYDAKRITTNGSKAWRLNIVEFFSGDVLRTFCWESSIRYVDKSIVDIGGCSIGDTPEESAKALWSFVQMILMFKKFAQVELKELSPGQKVKDINCNYKNDTKINVQILDSAWFTNLVKSDGFNVRGHFRLQPCKKNGEWTKELIWINEFGKSGYSRKAGILIDK